ncbi:MAG TPA: Flp pilus assembly protein CpaB [Polyangiales bacterium]|nr:Flp pilus assembly protein CpaB [Polyangiales bacterium]
MSTLLSRYLQRPLLLAAAIAAVAVLLAHLYLRSYEAQLSGGDRVGLMYVTKSVNAGAVLSEDVLAVRMVPLAYVDERDVRAADRAKVVGIAASFDLNPQQKLQWTDLTVRQDSRLVSQLILPGKRAVAVSFARQESAAALSLVRPGDYVDVVATDTTDPARLSSAILLQSVLVLAVGDRTERAPDGVDKPKGQSDQARSLTLSLDLDESQLLALAAARGELAVAVRNPEDLRRLDDVPELRVSNLEEGQRVLRERRRVRAGAETPVRLSEAR